MSHLATVTWEVNLVKQRTPPLMPPMQPPAARSTRAPAGMSTLKVGAEGREVLERQALEIFTSMANQGRPFAECLSSILLSGLDWGLKLGKEKE